jgi:putative ABC transport system substrate-binding protein
MKRRTFIAGLGSAAAWPVVARAQHSQRTRRIGLLSATPADDPEAMSCTAAFLRTLQELGWTEGRNVRIDIRWGTGDRDRVHRGAEELVAFAPDVILANGAAVVGPLLQVTRSIPVVTSTVSSTALSPPTCRCSSRPNWSLSST